MTGKGSGNLFGDSHPQIIINNFNVIQNFYFLENSTKQLVHLKGSFSCIIVKKNILKHIYKYFSLCTTGAAVESMAGCVLLMQAIALLLFGYIL